MLFLVRKGLKGEIITFFIWVCFGYKEMVLYNSIERYNLRINKLIINN